MQQGATRVKEAYCCQHCLKCFQCPGWRKHIIACEAVFMINSKIFNGSNWSVLQSVKQCCVLYKNFTKGRVLPNLPSALPPSVPSSTPGAHRGKVSGAQLLEWAGEFSLATWTPISWDQEILFSHPGSGTGKPGIWSTIPHFKGMWPIIQGGLAGKHTKHDWVSWFVWLRAPQCICQKRRKSAPPTMKTS